MNITKMIPFNIRIKTLYWVRKEKEINKDLEKLFKLFDDDRYIECRLLLEELREKWIEFSHKAPQWFVMKYIPEFTRAEAMLNFMQAPLEP